MAQRNNQVSKKTNFRSWKMKADIFQTCILQVYTNVSNNLTRTLLREGSA